MLIEDLPALAKARDSEQSTWLNGFGRTDPSE